MNKAGKTVDTTYLSLETAEERGFIHRDYIAHCLRWSHVIKYLSDKRRYETARILDVGCGRELPLASTMYSSRLIPQQYYGVDVGPVNDSAMAKFHTGKFPINVWERTNFLNITPEDVDHRGIDVITCFEVLEHVEPEMMIDMLYHMKTLLSPNGRAFISTPCWDVVSCAANHVNEMRYQALGRVFLDHGWDIVAAYGTFASIREYEHLLSKTPGLAEIFNRLRSYYDVNYLATVFAPLFPGFSRNCLWEIVPYSTKNSQGWNETFLDWDDIPKPWGSSAKWGEMRCESH